MGAPRRREPRAGHAGAGSVRATALTGNAPADAQAEIARLSGVWGLGKVTEISDEQARDDLGRLSAQVMAIVARSARVADGHTDSVARRCRRGGEDCGGAISAALARRGRPAARHGDRHVLDLHGGARPERVDVHGAHRRFDRSRLPALRCRRRSARSPARCTAARPAHVIPMIDEVSGDGRRRALRRRPARARRPDHGLRASRVPRRGPARPASRANRRRSSVAPRRDGARARVGGARGAQARHPERVLATNVEYWAAVVLDVADIPAKLTPAMFACARVAGWSAHILEQKRVGPADPAVGSVHRPRPALALIGLVTLAEAAAEADALAQAGDETALAHAPVAVGRGDRGGGARRRLPRARPGLSRDRAVPLPAEARAAAPRARGREPGGARVGAHRARGPLADAPGRRQRVPPAPPRARCARPERRRQAARDRLPEERHAAARDTIQLLDGIADSDEEDAELRKTARSVSTLLVKKSRAK